MPFSNKTTMTDKAWIYVDKALTIIGVLAFVALVVFSYLKNPVLCYKVTGVCVVSFVIVTIIRKMINRPRPKKDGALYDKKEGEAFPSRHTFSMAIIALMWIYVNIPVGLILFVLAIFVGYVRVKIGAHSSGDVAGAIFLAIIFEKASMIFF